MNNWKVTSERAPRCEKYKGRKKVNRLKIHYLIPAANNFQGVTQPLLGIARK